MARLLVALFLLCLATASARADEFVLCLQKQLSVLGHDPGPHDGLWGRKTQAATMALHAATPELQAIPALTNPRRTSAISWCRELGARFAHARAFRPSVQKPKFFFDDGMTDLQKGIARSALRKANYFLRLRHRIDPASHIHFVVGADPAQIAANLKASLRSRNEPTRGASAVVTKVCSGDQGWRGFALFNHIVICVGGDMPPPAELQKQRDLLVGLFVHELVHTYQYEVSLAKTQPDRFFPKPRHEGPDWMVEGAAMMVGMDYYWRTPSKPGKPSISHLQMPVRSSDLRLDDITKVWSVEEYAVSRFAVFLLSKRFGIDAVLGYWQRIGEGQSREQAFQSQFGLSMDAYKTKFEEELRAHLINAGHFAFRRP